MNRALLIITSALVGALAGLAAGYGSIKGNYATACHNALYYDTTDDGTPRITYIGAEDTCVKEDK